ncbi:MAG: hypothetical protein K8R79_09120 [Calditrichales bacterium]|nr:hypothetical protein [Calditrichales bacterium]
MNIKDWIKENVNMISILLILIGIVLILISKQLAQGLLSDFLETFGVLFVSVFFVSFLYERFIAEKHFSLFQNIMNCQLKGMDNVQSMCIRFGIREIFNNRNEYEAKYPLIDLFTNVKSGGRILVVARSMLYLLNKADAFKTALKNGATIQLACIPREPEYQILSKICFSNFYEIPTAFVELKMLVSWIEDNKPTGTFELHIYDCPLPDSILYVEQNESNFLVWDLTFGRDLNEKRVFRLEPEGSNLGNDLLNRYNTIWQFSEPILKIDTGGDIKINKIDELLENHPAKSAEQVS